MQVNTVCLYRRCVLREVGLLFNTITVLSDALLRWRAAQLWPPD